MNKKSLIAIEKIISNINELKILTNKRDAEYFYNNLEMNILIELIYNIEDNINKINQKIKEKYSHINWTIIKDKMFYDPVFKESINVGIAWNLANNEIEKSLLEELNKLLENELPDYYHKLCQMRQNNIRRINTN